METIIKELMKQREMLLQANVKGITLSQAYRIREQIVKIDELILKISQKNVAP